MRFEYDQRKNRQNLAKHGVDFETAQFVFEDPYSLSQRDEVHEEEERYITLGEIAPGVVLFVVHTAFAASDGGEVVRFISARAATSREKKSYEEAHKRTTATDRRNRRKKGRGH
jgi:hypothetical protein